jgi:hypothetical protein
MRAERSEEALSEIVGFVLILALVVVASTLYLMYVVPAEGREDEITHMNHVKDRFVSYKESLDALWMRSLSTSEPGTRGVTLSTSFDLGTGGGNTQASGLFLSFMRPLGTAARMSVQRESGDTFELYIDNITEPVQSWDPGVLNYTSENYYWIQQSYSYEMGGVFLEQKNEGVSVKVAPALSVYMPYNGTRQAAKLRLVNLTLLGSATIGGTGPLRMETRLREDPEMEPREERCHNLTLRVIARNKEWADAWRQVFRDVKGEFDPDSDYIVVPGPDPSNNWSSITLYNRSQGTPGNPDYDSYEDVILVQNTANYRVRFQYAEFL